MKNEILSILALLGKSGNATSEGKLTWVTFVIIAGSIAAQLLLQAHSNTATPSSTAAFLGSALALLLTSKFYTTARTQIKGSLADFLKNPAVTAVLQDMLEPTAKPVEKGAMIQRIIDAPAIPIQPRFLATTPEQAAELEKFIPNATRVSTMPTPAELEATQAKLQGFSVEVLDPETKTARVENFPTKTEAALFVFAIREKGGTANHLT